MKVARPHKTISEKISRALREGIIPLEIARKLGVPLLRIAEVAMGESTARHHSSGQMAGAGR